MKRTRIILLALLTTLSCSGLLSAQNYVAIETLQEYLDLVRSYNLESAGYLWAETVQERAGRFPIEFEGIALKVDCVSPFMQKPRELLSSMRSVAQPTEEIDGDDFIMVDYFIRKAGVETRHKYYLARQGGYYWLTHPQDYYARDWPIMLSKFFRIHTQPGVSEFAHRHLLDQMDLFVEKMAGELALSDQDMELIETNKIEYFYCESDSVVKLLTGQFTRGLMDLATNDIITANLPHFHEVIHLLVNIKLGKLPLFTIPLLREGLAVTYGGRWGKRATALSDLGAFLYRERLIELDSILAYQDFQQAAGADIVYPVAGAFVSFLIDQLGKKKFYELYLSLSGDVDQMNAWDCQDIKEIILAKTSHDDWLDLVLAFDNFLDRESENRRAAVPGVTKKGREVLKGKLFRVTQDDEFYAFEFQNEASTPPTGNLLFGVEAGEEMSPSVLFAEQYQGQFERDGYRFGLRYDQFEAGLYDYVTNELVAKYIYGIAPSPDYFESGTGLISIKLRKSLINDYLGEEVNCRLLPN